MLLAPFFKNTPYHLNLIEHPLDQKHLIDAFALDDALLHELKNQPVDNEVYLHFWPADRSVFLGMQDQQLPHFWTGVEYLRDEGYEPIVRSSGGLAVVGDTEVLNFSLIFQPTIGRPNIHEAFGLMVKLIQAVFIPFNQEIVDGEVKRSYCPGKYDLSLKGKKIAGISQRRVGNAIALSIYVSLDGDQLSRGQLLRYFYKIGGSQPKDAFPDVLPESMTTVGDITPELRTLSSFEQAVTRVLEQESSGPTKRFDLEHYDYSASKKRMVARNQRLTF